MAFRLLLFVVIVTAAAASVMIGDLALGAGHIWRHLLVAVIALEAGYIVGMLIRAGLSAAGLWRAKAASDRGVSDVLAGRDQRKAR